MKKIKNFYENHNLLFTILLVTCLLAVLCCRYFITNGTTILGAQDITFHINRIKSIADGIKGGQFPVKIYPNAVYGYGYASSLFYPELFLYIPALLVLIGFNAIGAYIVFLFGISLTMCILFYFLAKKFTQSKFALTMCTLFFILNQYLFSDLFYRGALGEILSCLFFILVCLGVHNLLKENFSKPYLLLIGFLGITYSHTTSLFIVAMFFLVIILCNAKTLLKSKQFYIKSSIILILYLFLSMGVLVPLLEMMLSGKFAVNDPWILPSTASSNLIELLIRRHSIGIVAVIILFLRLFIHKTPENMERVKTIDKGLIYTAIIVFISSSLFPWKQLDSILYFIQFPFRFYVLTICTTPLLVFAILQEVTNKRKNKKLFFTIVILTMCVINCFGLQPYRYVTPNYESIGCGEWIPQGDNHITLEEQLEHYKDYQNIILSDTQESINYKRDNNSVRIEFYNNEDHSFYILPLLYYKGYHATLVEENGTTHNLEITRDEYACIKVINDTNLSGKIVVDYTGTSLQTYAYLISGSTLIGLILLTPIYYYIKKKKEYKRA